VKKFIEFDVNAANDPRFSIAPSAHSAGDAPRHPRLGKAKGRLSAAFLTSKQMYRCALLA